MLQSPKSAESSEFRQSRATEEQRRAYWAFQQRNVFHYRGWGRKDASSLEACKAQALAPHVDLFPPQFECIKKQLKDYLFGGDARLEAITRTLVQLNSHARQGLFILTKGIGSYVLAVVRSLAAHWIALLPGLLVVDYSGHMYSLAPGSEPFRGSTFPVDHKIPQMLGVFAATQQPIPAFILLIDDGYEGELRHVPKEAEVEISLVKDQYILKGSVDLIRGENDTVEIIDFKSEKKPDMEKDRDRLRQYQHQLEVYAHLVEERTGQKVSRMHLYYTGEDGGNPYVSFSKDDLSIGKTVALFDDIVNRIERRDYQMTARPAKLCQNCDMRAYCDSKNWKFRKVDK
jgi:DNA helicase-2/ATP-dependent DNA helicase PcrA